MAEYPYQPGWVINVDDPASGVNTPEFTVVGDYSDAIRLRDAYVKELASDPHYANMSQREIATRVSIRSTAVVFTKDTNA